MALTDETAYERHRPIVLGYLARHHPDVEPDERLSLYHEAWSSVLRRRAAGDPVAELEPYLIGAVKLAARHRRRTAASRRTEPRDPLDAGMVSVADPGPSVHERVETRFDAALCREIIASLDERARALIKLRFDCGFEVDEVRMLLGLSERSYERVLERAREAIAERVGEVGDGRRERRHRSLLLACELGIASPRQRERARRLIADDPRTRAMARELRGLPAHVGALLPLPALHEPLGHGLELLATIKHHALGWIGRASGGDAPVQIAAAGGLRGSGTAAAAVAACLAAGGAASYCVVEGVPDPIRKLPSIGADREPERPRASRESTNRPKPAPAAPVSTVVSTPTPTPTARPKRKPAPKQRKRSEPAQTSTTPAPREPDPPSASPQEDQLGFERSGPGATTSSGPAPQRQPAAPKESGPGEFGQP